MKKKPILWTIALVAIGGAIWWLWPLHRPGSSSSSNNEKRIEASGLPLLGLALADDQVEVWDPQVPILLQVDLVGLPEEGATPGGLSDGLSLISRSSANDEAVIAFDFLSPLTSSRPAGFDAVRATFREIGIPPNALEIGRQTLVAQLTIQGAEPLTSNPITVEVGAGSMSSSERALWSARYQLDRDRPQEALATLDIGLAEDRSIADLHGLRGLALERQGDVRGAIDAYSKALDLLVEGDEETLEPPTYYLNRRRILRQTLNQRRPPS